jgi:hypothetical protein
LAACGNTAAAAPLLSPLPFLLLVAAPLPPPPLLLPAPAPRPLLLLLAGSTARKKIMARELRKASSRRRERIVSGSNVALPAREEVEGFQAMLGLRDEEGQLVYSVTSLAARLGKAKQFISRRLRLRHAPDSMWASYEAGAIGLRQMELVGQLPTEAARKKAADEVLRPSFRPTGNPLTVLETVAMLKEKFMVSLRGCGWDLEDEGLVPAKRVKGERVWGGGCADCPMRTGSDALCNLAASTCRRHRNLSLPRPLGKSSNGLLAWAEPFIFLLLWRKLSGAPKNSSLRVLVDEQRVL